mmetsp:Transcript_10815/g.19097  ORF Transcript_10815/g.19097 Transcript_10815/m.19097 type:complete len:256 (-) Transcript_10815:158-925(-)
MGLGELVQKSFFLLNVLVLFTGLGITGIGIYYIIVNNDSVFGSFSDYVTFMPITAGLSVSLLACIVCGCGLHESRVKLALYATIVTFAGIATAAAGGAQLEILLFADTIATTEDLSTLEPGLAGLQHLVSDFSLGLFDKCCLESNEPQFSACPGGAPFCFHNQVDFGLGFASDADVCDRVAVTLELCPFNSEAEDFQEFTTNSFEFLEETFRNASIALIFFGSVLFLTGIFGYGTVCHNAKRAKEKEIWMSPSNL